MKRAGSLIASICVICAAVLCFAACSPSGGTNFGPEVYYTVTFDAHGGSAVESQRVRSGNVVTRPETPVREGYYLTGWYEDPAAADEWDFDTERVTADITLYAGWELSGSTQPTASLVYERYGDGYAVTDVGEETEIVIPAEYEGLPVVAIQGQYGTGAFARTAITSVVIPDSITEIANNSFYNCSDLVSVRIGQNSALESIGRNAFSGCRALTAITIPAGVTSIGDSAFNNCGAVSFTVAAGNAAYRSEGGHLIESATDTLIRGGQNGNVPNGVRAIADAAFRQGAAVTELVIPASVREIGNYIFSGSAVASIRFLGSQEQWNAIEKGSLWNLGNENIAISFEN